MDRKRQKLTLEKIEVQTQCQEEEMMVLRQKIMSMEAELKLKDEEKHHLANRVTSLEQELVKKNEEQEHLVKRITSLEQELAKKETQLQIKIKEQERLENRVISLEQKLQRKETQLQLIKEPFDALPNEVVVEIFKHMTQNELGKIARVCRRWNDLTKSPVLWQNVNVEFHWSHASQNAVVRSFINRLPCSVTSISVEFLEINKWIQPLDFQELCATLQKKCPRLQKLILYKSKLINTRPSIIHLCSQFLTDVTTVALRYSTFLDSPARVQSGSPSKIQILDITGSDMKHFCKPVFSKMTSLRHLYLCGTTINYTWFEGDVSFLNQLEVLHLGLTSVGSTAFRAIRNHGLNLKELYMCCTRIDNDDLKFHNSAFPQLKTVSLNHCISINCEGVVSLVKSCPSLQNIYAHRTVVSSYAKHPFTIANKCKLGIVKDVECHKHDKKCYRLE